MAVVTLAMPAIAPAAPRCAAADLTPTGANVAAVRGATLCLLNAQRASRGLKTLRSSQQLRRSAQRYSQAMIRLHFFDHVSPGGGTLLGRVLRRTTYRRGAPTVLVGENLGWSAGDSGAGQMVAAWLASPTHRAVILDRRFRHVGIGIAIGSPGQVTNGPAATYTTHFGRRGAPTPAA